MQIEPHLSLVFDGDCDAAFTLYQQCLGGSVTFRLAWGDSSLADQAPGSKSSVTAAPLPTSCSSPIGLEMVFALTCFMVL